MQKVKRKDPKFIKFAKAQGGYCCLCRALSGAHTPAVENHHFGEGGMGLKGKDHYLARLCRAHHTKVQGKSRSWFTRNDELETWTALLEDGLELLSDFRFATMGKCKEVMVDKDVF